MQFRKRLANLPQLSYPDLKQFNNYDVRRRRVFPICICYFVDLRQIVPLKNVDYHVNIHSSLAVVQIVQQYENTIEVPANIEYLFTINQNAAFTKLEVKIGDKTLYGQIKEKELAKKEYYEGLQQGKTMVFSEKDDEQPDVMRVKLGNLEPGQQLSIVFEYIQPLDVCVNEFWRLDIDPVIHPRYKLQKQVGFMYRIQELTNVSNYNPLTRQNIHIKIDSTSPIIFCKSPTHSILVDQSAKQNQMEIELNPIDLSNFASDKCFTLLFSNTDIHKPQVYLTHTNNDALQYQKYCCTLSLIPQFNPLQLDDAYQAYLSESGIEANEFEYPQKGTYLFLLDRSGSMSGSRIEKAKEALNLFIKSLPEDSYFNVVSFGSRYERLFNEIKRYSKESITQAVSKIKNMKADLGGTEILTPLDQYIYKQKLQDGYPLNIFILTDGEVQAEPVIELVKSRCRPNIRVYTLGIGNGCDKYLIEKLARVGNGNFHFVSDDEDLNKKVIDLLQDSITPYLEQISFDTSITDYQCITPNTNELICLRKNTPVRIQMTFPMQNDSVQQFEVNFQAFDPQTNQKLGYSQILNLADSKESEYFHKLAAYQQIQAIEDGIKYREKTLHGVLINLDEITLDTLIQLSTTNQILSRTTAFVCEVKDMEDQFKQQQKKVPYYYHEGIDAYNGDEAPQIFRQMTSYGGRGGHGGRGGMFKREMYRCAPPMSSMAQISLGQANQPQFMQQLLQGNQSQMLGRMQPYPQASDSLQLAQTKKKKCSAAAMTQSSLKRDRSRSSGRGELEKKQKNHCLERSTRPQTSTGWNEIKHEKNREKCKAMELEDECEEELDFEQDIKSQKQINYQQILEYAEGNGTFNTNLISILQVKIPDTLSQNLWICILALAYLELRCPDDRAAWQLVYKKTIKFLSNNNIKYADYKDQAIQIFAH